MMNQNFDLKQLKKSKFLLSLMIYGYASFLQLPVKAQIQATKMFWQKHVSVSGQASMFGELYDAHGISQRRPPSTGRIAFTPTFTFSNLLSVSADLLLSTEGTQARQNMNIMGLHPVWKWGKAHMGDYSDHFSKYTFSGTNVKGAEIDFYPGRFRFTLGGGQTKRAVDGNVIHQSYSQYLFASRIGYGEREGSFFDVIFLKVKDDESSLKKSEEFDYTYVIPDTLETELDTLWVEPPYNPYTVTPQENMVAGFSSRLQFYEKRIIIELEGSGSAYTKNLNSEKVDIDSVDANGLIKDMLGGFFTPRRSSNMDFAALTNLHLNFPIFQTQIGYRYIGPGYMSLGIPSTVNDRREFLFMTSFKIKRHRIRFNWNRLSNNLLDQKLDTNTRNQFRVSWNTNKRKWQSSININYLLMANAAQHDSLEWDFNNLIFSTHQALLFERESAVRRLGIQYTFQTSHKEMPVQKTTANYHTLNLTGNFRLIRILTLNTSAGLSFRKNEKRESYTTQVYSIRLSHVALRNRLSSSFFSSSSMVRDTKVFRLGIMASYRLTSQNQIIFNLSQNIFRGTRDFHELRSSLMLSHRL